MCSREKLYSWDWPCWTVAYTLSKCDKRSEYTKLSKNLDLMNKVLKHERLVAFALELSANKGFLLCFFAFCEFASQPARTKFNSTLQRCCSAKCDGNRRVRVGGELPPKAEQQRRQLQHTSAKAADGVLCNCGSTRGESEKCTKFRRCMSVCECDIPVQWCLWKLGKWLTSPSRRCRRT